MKHNGGCETKGGFYWKKGSWEIVTVEGKSGTLPGQSDCEYMRVPGLLLFPVALIISVAYVVFLPLVGFAMVFGTLFRKMGILVGKSVPERQIEKRATVTRDR